MKSIKHFTMAVAVSFVALSIPAFAQIKLIDGVKPHPEDDRKTEVGKFKKKGSWVIGMSHFGISTNTWTEQMAYESEWAASRDKRINKFIMLDASTNPHKQAAHIENLVARKVDAIIVTPMSTVTIDQGINRAIEAGIPVIIHSGVTKTDDYTVEIQSDGFAYGKSMGDYVARKLNGTGDIWVLRGVATHSEEVSRYNGLLDSIKGTNIKVAAEDNGNWSYAEGKKSCEIFYLKDPEVDAIWSSDATMSIACIDVFKQFNNDPPTITGGSNNGFLGEWVNGDFDSIAPEYSPALGAAAVRAAIALLEGKSINKRYVYDPESWDFEKAKKFYRDDLTADVWWPTELPEERLQQLYSKKK